MNFDEFKEAVMREDKFQCENIKNYIIEKYELEETGKNLIVKYPNDIARISIILTLKDNIIGEYIFAEKLINIFSSNMADFVEIFKVLFKVKQIENSSMIIYSIIKDSNKFIEFKELLSINRNPVSEKEIVYNPKLSKEEILFEKLFYVLTTEDYKQLIELMNKMIELCKTEIDKNDKKELFDNYNKFEEMMMNKAMKKR